MPDAALDWNSDFTLTPAGDLALADGDDLVKQRLIRRLFTAARGCVFHLEYGAGLPQKIGSTLSPRAVAAVVRAQLALEASVAASPPASVQISEPRAGLQTILIRYTDALTGQHVSLDLSI